MPGQKTIKFRYFIHRQQPVARINYAFDAEPYCATSIANILTESYFLAEIKRGVTLHMLKNTFATHLPEQGGDLGYIQENNSCSFQTNLDWKEQLKVQIKENEHNRYKTTLQ